MNRSSKSLAYKKISFSSSVSLSPLNGYKWSLNSFSRCVKDPPILSIFFRLSSKSYPSLMKKQWNGKQDTGFVKIVWSINLQQQAKTFVSM